MYDLFRGGFASLDQEADAPPPQGIRAIFGGVFPWEG